MADMTYRDELVAIEDYDNGAVIKTTSVTRKVPDERYLADIPAETVDAIRRVVHYMKEAGEI